MRRSLRLLTLALLLGSTGVSFALPPCPAAQRRDNCFGTHTTAGGDKYAGEYRDNKYSGQGAYTYANGRKEEGIWIDGKFQNAQKVTPPEAKAERKKSQEHDAQLVQARQKEQQAAEAKAAAGCRSPKGTVQRSHRQYLAGEFQAG